MMHKATQDPSSIYNIPHWGDGFFQIREDGALCLRIADHPLVPISEVVNNAGALGLNTPLLIRFTDILTAKVDQFNQAFSAAMDKFEYKGNYQALYPIKVNQQKSVVSSLRSGSHKIGLEAGSKPELLAILGQTTKGTIVCNGYKDMPYIRMALMGCAMGHKLSIVVEKLSEIESLIDAVSSMGIKPNIGLRVRLSSIAKGKWQNSGGEKSKFGLNVSDLLNAVNKLKQADLLSCVNLLHFHMGSQIGNIRDIQQGIREASRHYVELIGLGVPLDTMDIGGGVGIDYEGTRSRSDCSMNYTIEEYANQVIHTIKDVCDSRGVQTPHIYTEAGRAMTAHHALLVSTIADVETCVVQVDESHDSNSKIIKDLKTLLDDTALVPMERYHELGYLLNESRSLYNHGLIDLRTRAQAEAYYTAICQQIRDNLDATIPAQREILDSLNQQMADKVFCNFSLFQSVPDVWAIAQIFPIVPLNHLDKPITQSAVIQDITCDSDGRFDQYVNGQGIEPTLALPKLPGKSHLGIFLVGAYQEILGDIHNLFGRTNTVHVHLSPSGEVIMDETTTGEQTHEVLAQVNYDATELMKGIQHQLQAAELPEKTYLNYMQECQQQFNGSTYLSL